MKKRGAGSLRAPIMIEHYQETRDDFGGTVKEWILFQKVWGSIKPIAGKEYFSASKENAEISHRVVIRFLDGVLPNMRINHRNRVLEIVSVRDFEERTVYLELMCREVIL